jgi:hypothetical protein
MRAKKTIDNIWQYLAVGQEYRTPDDSKGVNFRILTVEPTRIIIRTVGRLEEGKLGSKVAITRLSFEAALAYLYSQGYDLNKTCEIKSNNNILNAGSLCVAARTQNNGTRCINYILPVLKSYGFVGINGGFRNRAWFV